MRLLLSKINSILDEVAQPATAIPLSTRVLRKDASIYAGTGGLAYLYLRVHCYLAQFESLEDGLRGRDQDVMRMRSTDFLALAEAQCEASLAGIGKEEVSFYFSDCGIQLLQFRIALLKQDKASAGNLAAAIVAAYSRLEQVDEDELLYGAAGYLYIIVQLQRAGFPTGLVPRLLNQLVERGLSNYKAKIGKEPDLASPEFRLVYTFHQKEYLGAAHGLAGILQVMLRALPFAKEQADRTWAMVKGSVRFIQGLQNENGSWQASAKKGAGRLVQFCHGSPGVSVMLCTFIEEATRRKEEEVAGKALLALGNGVFNILKEGLLLKGFGLCHGISGNAYAFLSVYRLLGKYPALGGVLKREDMASWLKYFASLELDPEVGRRVKDYKFGGRKVQGVPDSPFSLMEGSVGDIVFLMDLLSRDGGFPGFDD